ncbi:MAG: aminotransferase class V-fold PLP-dependent enzyme [Myxococcales bacterium]|nr:aminotransferase class V-fold PLP-dependent enzyme [Myxococcales bacterium]
MTAQGHPSGAIPSIGARTHFPKLTSFAYLNHASQAPLSAPVCDAIAARVDLMAREGTGAFPAVSAGLDRVRAQLAALLGAAPDEVGLVSSTTTGVLHVAYGLAWAPGDRVVLFDGEFPANVTPWLRAAETFGVEPVFVPLEPFHRSHDEGLAAVDAALEGGRVRLVAVSAVQYRSGLRMPVEALAARAHAHGAALFVDVAQALGMVPFEVGGADFVAGSSHKWLLGPEAAGLLYIAPSRLAELVPRLAGWASVEHAFDFLSLGPGRLDYARPVRRRADFVEGAGRATLAYAGLEAALTMLSALDPAAVFAHVGAYLDRLERPLTERGFRSLRTPFPEGRSGILALEPPLGVDGPALQAALTARGVACSLPDGALRLSPHYANALEEVPEVLAAFDAAV